MTVPLPSAGDTDWIDWAQSVHSYSRGVSITSAGATTGAANNATAIQGLIDAAAAAGGGTVWIPAGTWNTGPLALKTGVRLVGENERAARLQLVNGANTHMITLADGNTENTGIETLYLDGNKANQTAGDVVHLDNTGYNNAQAQPSLADPNHYLRRVVIVNAKGHGFYAAGSYHQTLVDSAIIKDCDGNSVNLAAPDCHLISVVSARSGLDGIYIGGNSNRLMNCKAFLSGRLDATNGSGFRVNGVSRADLTHCESQDNRQHGYSLFSTAQTALVGCRADRNGLGPDPVTTGWGGDGIFCGNVTDSRIDLIAGDRNDGGTRLQRWAYNCSTGNDRNLVTLVAGTGGDGTKGGNGSFGVNSVGWVRWNATNATGAFA